MHYRLAPLLFMFAVLAAGLHEAQAQGAPAVGRGHVVQGRCLTIVQVVGPQFDHEWRDGNAFNGRRGRSR